jgi:hypothetical protein
MLSEVDGVMAEIEHMRVVINSRWEGRGSIAVESKTGLHGLIDGCKRKKLPRYVRCPSPRSYGR